MTKTERIERSSGNPSRIGAAFCAILEKGEFWQGRIMRKIADWKIGREAISNYERIYGGGTRPTEWWKIKDRRPLIHGYTPQPGGWFYSAGINICGWWLSYGCGWGDSGTWKFKRAEKKA